MRGWGRFVVAALIAILTGCASRGHAAGRTSLVEVGEAVGLTKLRYIYEARSPFVVAIIPEFHHLPGCQSEVYAMLESLEPMTAFVAIEGRIGELKHDQLLGAYLGSEGTIETYEGLTNMSLTERRQVARRFREAGFPRAAGQPIGGAVLYEAVYQDRVRSQGLEKQEVYLRANRIADLYSRYRLPRAMPRTTIIGARNRIFVRKLRHYGNYLRGEGRDVVPFPVGAMHVADLTRRLRANRISFGVLVSPQCVPLRVARRSRN